MQKYETLNLSQLRKLKNMCFTGTASEAWQGLQHTTLMVNFVTIVYCCKPLSIVSNLSILNICGASRHAFSCLF